MNLKLIGILSLLLVILPAFAVFAQAQQEIKGPPLDKIVYTVRTTIDRGVLDVADGKIDVFMWAVSPRDLKQIPVDLAKLKLIPSSSTLDDLLFNPYSDENEAGKWGVATDIDDGTKHFNPFAIREIRFAMNWLISRRYIIDNIMAGGANPMYCPVGPSHPAYPQIEPVIKELGLTDTGDEAKALQMINNALQNASQHLAKLGYKLYKASDGYWHFQAPGQKDEVVTVTFLIRIEDERRDIGHYVADLIEKAGIKVNRMEIERGQVFALVYGKDARTLDWHIYTEGWISTAESPWIEGDLAWYYSQWGGPLPGWGTWEYTPEHAKAIGDNIQPKIENLTLKLYQGYYKGEEYWKVAREIIKLGIEESIRVFLTENLAYYPVNPRVHDLVAGRSTGLATPWAFRTAWTDNGVLLVAQFSSRGALFMSAWNPVGGINDVYADNIWRYVRDYGGYWHPSTGIYTPMRVTWNVQEGNITVPGDALIYNHSAHKWQTLDEAGVKDRKATAKVILNYKFSDWHDGRPMTLFDVLESIAWNWEWSYKDGPDDVWYHDQIASTGQPYFSTIKGIEIINSTAIAIYGNYTHPISKSETASYYMWWPTFPFEVMAAMEYCVLYKGPVSGQTYGWFEGDAGRWIDALDPDHLKDITAALEQKVETGEYMPPYLKATYDLAKKYPVIKPVNITEAAKKALEFYKEYGHLVISNGPFYIAKYNPTELYLELKAFRDPTYPFTPDYWRNKLVISTLFIQEVSMPTQVLAGQSIPITVKVGENVKFPETEKGTRPAEFAYVDIALIAPDGTVIGVWSANKTDIGVWQATIPGSATKNLASGAYTIEIRIGREPGVYQVTERKQITIIGIQITTTTPTTAPTVTAPTITQPTITSPSPTTSVSPTVTVPSVTTSTSPIPTVTTLTPTGPGIGPTVIIGIAVVIIIIGVAAAFLVRKK